MIEERAVGPPTPVHAVDTPPGTPRWITPTLVELTLRVWQPHYRDPLSIDEAVRILLRMGALVDALRGEG